MKCKKRNKLAMSGGINDQMREIVDICTVSGQTIEDVYREINEIDSVELNPPSRRIVMSPRSAKACIQTGINPNYLMMRDFDSFKDVTCDEEIQKMRHEAYENRRQEHIRIVRTAKKKLVKLKTPCFTDEQLGTSSGLSQSSKLASSTMILEERKRIKRMQERHHAEIENVLNFEIKTQEIQNAAAAQLAADKERDKQQQQAVMLRAKKRNEERRHRAEEARKREAAEDRAKKAHAYQMYLEEKEQAEALKAKETIVNLEARIREDERQQKAAEYKEATAAILKAQQDSIINRMNKMEEAEAERQKQQHKAQKRYKKILAIKRKRVKDRIQKSMEAGSQVIPSWRVFTSYK